MEVNVDEQPTYASDVAFTPSVKAVQTRKRSRPSYERMEQNGSWQTSITPELAAFIEAQTSIFLATASLRGAALHSASRRSERLLARC